MSGQTGAPVPDTTILAVVEHADDARTAAEAGARAVLADDGQPRERTFDGALALHWLSDWRPGSLLPDVASGAALVLTASPGRLLSRYDFPDLVRFAEDCRAAGTAFGFAGALEAPDVPRLLPLGPLLLAFEGFASRPGCTLNAPALRALVASTRSAPRRSHHPVPDRVYIRDFVQEMEIGAYRSEHGRRQRVRFGVEAELAPVEGPRTLADIYSYDRMMDAVRAIAARAPEPFVESLAESLAAEILEDERVQAVVVRVEKLDLGPVAAGVEIRRARP